MSIQSGSERTFDNRFWNIPDTFDFEWVLTFFNGNFKDYFKFKTVVGFSTFINQNVYDLALVVRNKAMYVYATSQICKSWK